MTDLWDHRIVVDANVTALLDAAVYTDLTEKSEREEMFIVVAQCYHTGYTQHHTYITEVDWLMVLA